MRRDGLFAATAWCTFVWMPFSTPGDQHPQFVEVSREIGIDFEHVNGASGSFYPPEVNGGGLAAFDYDNDGWVDLYVVNGAFWPENDAPDAPAVNRLYRNLGNGRFADVTREAGVGDTGYGMGCAAADYDNDGDRDLYVSNYGPNVLYRNEGDGRFVDATEEAGVGDEGWGGGVAFADYDGDGDLDLYVANYVRYRLGEEGGGSRIPYLSETLRERARGDLPLYASPLNFPAASNRFYRNDGIGRFVDVAAGLGVDDADGRAMGVVFSDCDGDGDPDLFVSDDQGGNSLFRNDGPWPGGRFSDVGLFSGTAFDGDGNAQATMGVAAGDYNNDGRFDLATTAFQDEVFAFYRNEGAGLFLDVAYPSGLGQSTRGVLGWGVFFFDYDNDGWLDLFLANGHVQDGIEQVDPGASTAQSNALFRNMGNGSFEDVSSASGPGLMLRRQSRGAVCFDYDNDGDLDIAVLNRYCRMPGGVVSGVDVLRNDGGNRGHWLKLTLRGRGGGPGSTNASGVGARVTVWTGRRRQVREVRAGSGYQSQNDIRVHVGLGKVAGVDSMEVRWPGGARQMLYGLEANREMVVAEAGPWQ